ncbi:unnamed protein product [Rotaria magnacalcarata]|uniref:Uncharacterized protein n=2 Tax=Rotaria magnacalcarata TaxID=392030 RepID=A0A816RAF0_9BILA|nr:unnamed protein product [Rotaria magnacalcarata]
MADDNIEDASLHPFFVRTEFPFVFIPTTSTARFNFANSDTQDFISEDQTTTECLNEKETTDDEADHKEQFDHNTDEEYGLRISQPKYSALLKNLDFSETRMVDVTNLLSDNVENGLTQDNNENEKKEDESIDQHLSLNIDGNNGQTKDNENSKNTNDDLQNELNHLAAIIEQATKPSTDIFDDKQKNDYLDEDDDTSKQATHNYDLNDYDKEGIGSSLKPKKNSCFTAPNANHNQDDNLSSIPRLNTSINNHPETQDQSIEHAINWYNLVNGIDEFVQPVKIEIHTTPIKEKPLVPAEEKLKQKAARSSQQRSQWQSSHLSRSSSSNSDSPFVLNRSNQKETSTSHEQEQTCTTASDILLQRLSNQQTDRTSTNRKISPRCQKTSRSDSIEYENNIQSTKNDNWLSTLEKLEQEHKKRLEQQQKQYEAYMHNLEENMKRRFDQYLVSTDSLQESKSDTFKESIYSRHANSSFTIDSNSRRLRTYSSNNQYRPLADQLVNQQSVERNLSKSQSREDISNLRAELSAKHAKHISDLKLYYEHEINELKRQLNVSKMSHTSSTSTRQSMETIERINNENIRLHDEMKELYRSFKINQEENHSLKRQLEELHDEINNKDVEMKNYHRKTTELEEQLKDAQNIKERRDENRHHIDRQASFYREENENTLRDLNLTRERLICLEERYRELENEHKILCQQTLKNENSNQRINDDHGLRSTMSLNMPTSREYGRFTFMKSRNENIDSGRYKSKDSNHLYHHDNYPETSNKTNDNMNEKSFYTQIFKPSSKPLHSPRKSSSNQHHCIDQMPVVDFVNDQIRQSEQLETRFDELLKKKSDLESRINRIPIRGLTSSDKQLVDVLEREIERVEQQLSSVKLELRKMNILPTY